jgi:uncharacterized membrane protein YhaH (DUF805 family)
LGAVFVVLSLGMACIHISLGILFLMEERLPVSSTGWLGARGRFWLSISPVAAVFLVAEWLSITNQGSFAGLLGFVGVVALPLLGGIFPVLLLAATRRRGDFVPGLVLRPLGNSIILVGTYLIFLGSIFVYGLFIYEDIVERGTTLLIGIAVLVVTVITLRRGALNKRVVVEVCEELGSTRRHVIRCLAGGHLAEADVTLGYGDRCEHIKAAAGEITSQERFQSVTINLPATVASELKVWVHRITAEWVSQPVPAILRVRSSKDTQEFDLQTTGGQIVLPLHGKTSCVEIALPDQLTG